MRQRRDIIGLTVYIMARTSYISIRRWWYLPGTRPTGTVWLL